MEGTSKKTIEKSMEWPRLLEEIRSLRNRVYNAELARLQESKAADLERAMKDARNSSNPDLKKASAEMKKLVEDEHERTKQMLDSKFGRLDAELVRLGDHFTSCASLNDGEAKAEQEIEALRQKVKQRDVEILELRKLAGELDARLASGELDKKKKEIDEREADLRQKIQAYGDEMNQLSKQREELDKDARQLGERRAEIDKASANLKEEVVQAMVTAFEGFARKLLNP